MQPGAELAIELKQGDFGNDFRMKNTAGNKIRRAHRRHDFLEETCPARRGIAGSAVAERQIGAALLQVFRLVVGDHLDIEIGKRRLHGPQARQQPQPGNADAGGDGHRSAYPGITERLGSRDDLRQRAAHRKVELFPLGGEADGSMAANQQLHRQRLLQRTHLTTDRRLRHAQGVCSLRNAHPVANDNEGLQEIERNRTAWGQSGQSEHARVTGCVERLQAYKVSKVYRK